MSVSSCSLLFARMRSASQGAIAQTRTFVFACLLLGGLGGCGLLPDLKDETAGWSAERLYKEAHDELVSANYTRATKLFDTLESRYPYGRLAQQAILENAYASYRNGDTATAAAACDRFIRTYPNHPSVDYAYYLKGLVYFREDQGVLGYVYEADLSEREPKGMRESFDAFKELVAKFPQSRYAQDSEARMRYLTNSLALYEVKVGRYYYGRGAYVAAVNRAQLALTNYPRTPATEDALDLLAASYDHLGLTQLRDDAMRLLKSTFPNSRYLAGSPSRPWWKIW
ncbi:MAG: outer membrane protein assembly factor BamD [Pseudomonadota bacterium]|nr:outer membrane protein assembly factor BamD [Pseudomonadota bacterium]